MTTAIRSLVRDEPAEDVALGVGRVARADDGEFVVAAAGAREWRARRAVSCLVEPIPGDRVTFTVIGGRECFVTAVLEREPGAAHTIKLEGDVHVAAPSGALTLSAQRGMELVSGGELGVAAARLALHVVDGNVAMERLTLLAGEARAEVQSARYVGVSLDVDVERATQKLGRSYRFVADFDQLRAGRIDYSAKGHVALHGENALVTATELVKVDGGQIHLG